MSDHIYKHIEITGTSSTSMQAAIENAIARSAKTVQNMRWFEVVGTRGTVEDARVTQWQVTLKIGFTLKD